MIRSSVVLTVTGPDESGLVDRLAAAVAEHGGNWEESRMSRLAGHFAGVVHVTVGTDQVNALSEAVRAVPGLVVDAVLSRISPSSGPMLTIKILGDDHEGLLRGVTQRLVQHSLSIRELWTGREEAPHAGGMLFRARLRVAGADTIEVEALRRDLESLADDLMIEITEH